MRIFPGKYTGAVAIPASKSDSQRAILSAGLASGTSQLLGVGISEDENAMLSNVRNIGAEVEIKEEVVTIKGVEKLPQVLDFNLGESGLGSRLIAAICCIHPGKYTLNGTGTLLDRPFDFYRDNFVSRLPNYSDNEGKLPLHIEGGFSGGEIRVSGKLSSQYISGLLMALPLAEKDSTLIVEELNSSPYVQMTLNTLKKFGIKIEHKNLAYFTILGNQKYLANDYKIEGDWSSASYWLVASALGQNISVSGLSMSSSQADKIILDAFLSANCKIIHAEEGLKIEGNERKPLHFDLTNAPDLFPALASFAALTEGESRLKGLHRLEHKESDRGLVLQAELNRLGVDIELNTVTDEMVIHGKKSISGGDVNSQKDHRIAMSLAVLGLFSDEPVFIENADAIHKSYPQFWDHLKKLKV